MGRLEPRPWRHLGSLAGMLLFGGALLAITRRGGQGTAVRYTKTATAAFAVLAVFVAHSWAYQVVDAETRFRGFMIPMLAIAYILSTIGEKFQCRFLSKRRKWILLGDEREIDTLSKELEYETSGARERYTLKSSGNMSDVMEREAEEQVALAVGRFGPGKEEDLERVLKLKERGECVLPLLSWCEQELQRIPPEFVVPEWLIQAEGFGLRPGSISWRIKRFGDVLGAFTLIVLTSPLLIAGGLLVWLEDRGPVFYRQKRSGLYGRPIWIYKLRSMKVDAEKSGAQWASRYDSRITRVGKIIRATRIDELPQLFSVISGDLSLIGPRPERPEIEVSLEKEIPNYRIRHWIRPGLSGWAQVCYPYGASIKDSRMKLSYDLYYLRNASLALDVLVTIKTMKLIANAEGSSPSVGGQKNICVDDKI